MERGRIQYVAASLVAMAVAEKSVRESALDPARVHVRVAEARIALTEAAGK